MNCRPSIEVEYCEVPPDGNQALFVRVSEMGSVVDAEFAEDAQVPRAFGRVL